MSVPAVIVPTWNRADLLADLLDSLRRQTLDHEVIVVDNGSTDGTAGMVAGRYPEVRLLRLPENVGFGRAVNRGARASQASTLVLLNNDVVCEPEFLERLCAKLDPGAGTVMAGGVLLGDGAPGVIDSAGIQFDGTLLAFDYLHGEDVSVLDSVVPEPIGPCAGAAAIDRATFVTLGGFDENFFAYLEDVDLVARAVAAGGRCRLVKEARAIHRHSATLGSGSRRKNELMGWSRGYTLAKYRLHRHPRLFARALAAEAAIATGQLLMDRTAIGFRARVEGFRTGLGISPQPLPDLPERTRNRSTVEVLEQRLRRRRSPT